MMRFIFLVIAIVVFMFVFGEDVKPYTDKAIEKGKFVWTTYLVPAKDFISTQAKKASEDTQTPQ